MERKVAKANRKRTRDANMSTSRAVIALKNVFREYSFEDIWAFIFICDLWLPNIGAYLKHQYLVTLMLSLPKSHFKPESSLSVYENFQSLFLKIAPLLPSFPMAEDFVPEADWGEIKYSFDGHNYPILYGCELAAIPDCIASFELMYVGYDKEYREDVSRSPQIELKTVLMVHEHMINAISKQPRIAPLQTLKPGTIELPPFDFWSEVSSYIANGTFASLVDGNFKDHFSILPDSLDEKLLNFETFQNNALVGNQLEFFFIYTDGKYLPILPRRFAPILINSWGNLYRSNGFKFRDHGMRYTMKIVGGLSKYLRERIEEQKLFPLINALVPGGEHHELIFSAGIQAKDKLLLVYVTDPVIGLEQWKSDLHSLVQKLQEAVALIAGPPIRMNLNLERKGIEFSTHSGDGPIKVLPIIVVPQTQINTRITIPEPLRHFVFFLEQFLGIVDEARSTEEISDFIEFLIEYGDMLNVSEKITPLDKMFEFRESHGVLIPGVQTPTLYFGNTHGGSHLRFKSLLEFWRDFPTGAWGVPRGWEITKAENGSVNLRSRRMRLFARTAKAGKTSLFISFPIEEFEFEQAQLSDFLAQIIQDGFHNKNSNISSLTCLNTFSKADILLFPRQLLTTGKFNHLKHLEPITELWRMDIGWPAPGEPGIRIVFDEQQVKRTFEHAQDARYEIQLLKDVMFQLNQIASDAKFFITMAKLDSEVAPIPRFRIGSEQQIAITPRIVSFERITQSDYKLARKRLAAMARDLKIPTGTFPAQEALAILAQLRDVAISDIDDIVKSLSFEKSVRFLIRQIEGLRQNEAFGKQRATMAKSHDVDYDVASSRFEDHQEFISNHRNFRYLIEKFVQLTPTGGIELSSDRFRSLIAQIDWLQSIYQTSDYIHYDIEPASVSFDSDYTIAFTHHPSFEQRHKEFGEQEAKLGLGLIGNPDDRIKGGYPGTDIINDLNIAMAQDFGFTYEEMVSVATALAQWAHFLKIEPSSVYSASIDEAVEVISKAFEDFPRNNVRKVIEFFVLEPSEMLTVLNDPNPARDLPIWEYSKRPARYNLRPIIFCKNRLCWGPQSILVSLHLWANAFLDGAMPVKLSAPNMIDVITKRKRVFEDLLEKKTVEVVKRFTPFARGNVELHRIDKSLSFPRDLGDFDAIAFFPKHNLIIAFEAKHIGEAYCAKDARRLREKIFGVYGKDEGYIGKIKRRHTYLEEHVEKICMALKWPSEPLTKIRVETVYVAQRAYWWTMFPPSDCTVQFTVIDLLEMKIRDLLGIAPENG